MKQIRVFSSAEIRDAVFKAVDYAILCKTEGVGIGMRHEVWRHDYSVPFYVENTGNDVQTLSIVKKNSSAPTLTIEYSADRSEWTPFENPTSTTAITLDLQPGDKIYLRCETEGFSTGGIKANNISGVSKVGGNIMSLLYGSSFTGRETSFKSTNANVFDSLFASTDRILTDASELILPATTLAERCYASMFAGCKSLTQAPELPATTLATNCYYRMFYNCSSLRTAPELPATALVDYCYSDMFLICKSLTQAPELPATTLASNCYKQMFRGCTSLVQAPELPVITLTKNCYENMFQDCTSLVQAPELPATTLAERCYYQMFRGCTNLNYIKCLATDISASNCLRYWTAKVSSTGTFTKALGVEWPAGSAGIPEGWTVEEI